MNNMWRITKYNPANRDGRGVYLMNEWTSYSDIGKHYNGVEFTVAEYEQYEKAYIDSILCLMECNSIETLKIVELEKYEDENADERINSITEGMMLSKKQIKIVAQHVLREKLWCKLVLDKIFYVHFGYDYNMYIGSCKKCEKVIKEIECKNMYIEPFKSPYLD